MGIDFIRSKGGKPYVKRWADGLDRTRRPQLLSVELTSESRSVTAELTPGCVPQAGAPVLVQSTGGGDLVVYEGLKAVARIVAPPPGVTARLAQCHGIAPALVERVGGFGRTVEIKLK